MTSASVCLDKRSLHYLDCAIDCAAPQRERKPFRRAMTDGKDRSLSYIVGVDIGGTFTDAAAVRYEDGRVFAAKAPSTPDDLTRGLLDALKFLARDAGETLESLLARTRKFAHGTTQTSNIMLTWVGASTGLITTSGFADEILIHESSRTRGRTEPRQPSTSERDGQTDPDRPAPSDRRSIGAGRSPRKSGIAPS